jgi:hypothetical protein
MINLTGGLYGEDCARLLAELEGNVVLRLRRVFWAHRALVVRDRGWVEITAGAVTGLFTTGQGGTRLRGSPNPWIEKRPQELSPVALRMIDEQGDFEPFDVSGDPLYKGIVGHKVTRVELIREELGRLSGFELCTNHAAMRCWVDSDEFYVAVRDMTSPR